VLTAVFTAGPNPVAKSLGVVNFYHQGKSIKAGTLTVFDASGNAINKIAISDRSGGNAVSGQSRRAVGSWDLTGRRGRPVSVGTYLVRGVITMSDGSSERLALTVGVR